MNNDHGYALHKSRQTAEAVLYNALHRAPEMPYALGAPPGTRRGTVVVVGAGPSLDRTAHHLPRLAAEGASIFTVNTALPKVAAHVTPDVVVAREIVDVSAHVVHPARLRVLDLGAHPRVWDAAMKAGPCAWFVPGADQYFDLAATMGVRPLFGGQAAVTSAVALAEQWGAGRIILLGCDLAIDDDGKSYADGTAFSGQRAVIGDDGMAENGGPGFAVKQAAHEAGGIRGWPEREMTCVLERWGGGEPLRTTTQWIDQVGWLAMFAARHPEIACVDATGAGARKPGWSEVDAGALAGPFEAVAKSTAQLDADNLRARVRAALTEQAHRIDALAANVSHPHGMPVAVPVIMAGVDFVELMAARDVLLACDGNGSTSEKIAAVYGPEGAFTTAAARTLELLG